MAVSLAVRRRCLSAKEAQSLEERLPLKPRKIPEPESLALGSTRGSAPADSAAV